MNVRIHIERLVLDGLTLDAANANALQEAIEAGLRTLALERGAELAQLSAADRVQAPAITLGSPLAPQTAGAQIASSLWASLVPGGTP